MTNSVNLSDRERLENLWHQPPKSLKISDNVIKRIRQAFYWLITSLTAEDRIKVWSCSDGSGNTYWNAYDPISNHVLEQATESELRIWLEQRYHR
ncbi:MAG: hypothetical protein VKK42_15360 [Lyngbya sp.]|nr:hypothetical protein [Lyngbya sp.]